MSLQPLGAPPPATSSVSAESLRTQAPRSNNEAARLAAKDNLLPETRTVPSTVDAANAGRPRDAKNNPEAVKNAVQRINDFVTSATRDIQFSVDEKTETMVVKVVDRATKEVIRQIPSEEALRIAQELDKFRGLLVKDKA